MRIELFGEEVESIRYVDPITGEPLEDEGEMGMMGDIPLEPEIEDGITNAQLGKDTKKAEI